MTLRFLLLPLAVALAAHQSPGQARYLPELKSAILLPNVRGRIDHMTVDVKRKLVYVCALGNNSVEVASLESEKWLRSIPGFTEPQGISLDAELGQLFITNGGDGSCTVLDAESLSVLQTIPNLPDADNVRYDRGAQLLYIAYGSGGLAAIEPRSMKTKFTVSLPDHPESFQLEEGSSRIFANVPGARKIYVIDRAAKAVLNAWPVHGATANFPMALNERNHILMVGFRSPACMQALDTRTGKLLQSVPIGGDVDDIFYDVRRSRVYASCGGGELDVFSVNGSGLLNPEGSVTTRQGARTSLLVPELNILIVAAPLQTDKQAELMIYFLGR